MPSSSTAIRPFVTDPAVIVGGGIAGIACAAELNGAGIPVLLLTARGYAIEPEDRKTANLRGLLAKPFSPRELLAEIERELSAVAPAREAA